MRTKIILGICIVFLAVIISGCTSGIKTPNIELSTASFDMGDIDPDEGIRTETFFVKNTGGEILEITSISTSCGCTEAEVESKEIAPGEQTKLIVNYDPSVHPGLVGKIKRIVYIKSNDPFQEEIELELVGNSLASQSEGTEHEESEDHDARLLADFEISPHSLNKKIESGASFKLLDVREDFEYEESHIEDTLLLSVNEVNQDKLDTLGLKKDDEIILYCRSGRRSANAYEILTELGYTNVKSLQGGLVHWMEEGFSVNKGDIAPTLEEQVAGAASVSFDRLEHDFGEVPQYSGIVQTDFQVYNNGDSDLKVSSISTSCGCASAELSEYVISPGDSSILTITFDPDFHEELEGRFSRTIFLETNDPVKPEVEVKIWVDVLEGQ